MLWAIIIAKIKGNQIALGSIIFFRYCKFDIYGSGNHITIGDNCKLCGLRIYMKSGSIILQVGSKTIVNASKEQRTLFNPCEGGGIYIAENCLFLI